LPNRISVAPTSEGIGIPPKLAILSVIAGSGLTIKNADDGARRSSGLVRRRIICADGRSFATASRSK